MAGPLGVISVPALHGGSALNRLLKRFKSAGGQVGLLREDVGADPAYWLCQHLGSGRYWCAQLLQKTLSTRTNTMLNYASIRFPVLSKDQTDGSFVFTGTWSHNQTALANTYGGTYSQSSTTGAYVTFTSPDGVSALCLRGASGTNAGIGLVAIDGDNTAAHLLSSAQELVDAGTLADTVLVANGGTLNPTDRVIDFYKSPVVHDNVIPLVEGLAAGVHTVVITVTGYKRAAASSTRLYISGMDYAGPASRMSDVGIVMRRFLGLFSFSAGSAWEYAYHLQDFEGYSTDVFIGTIHGYEVQDSLAFTVDGEAAAPDNGALVTGSASVVATRASTLYHPDVGAGATQVGAVTAVYTMDPALGLRTQVTTSWDIAANVRNGYVAMFPCDELLDRAGGLGVASGVLTANDGTLVARGNTQALYCWDADGPYSQMLYMPNLATVNNWAHDGSGGAWVEDRNLGSLNKMYFARCLAGDMEAVTAESSWVSDVWRKVRRN